MKGIEGVFFVFVCDFLKNFMNLTFEFWCQVVQVGLKKNNFEVFKNFEAFT